LRDVPLIDRKRALREVLPGTGPIKFSEHIEGDGITIWHRACELGLEGTVSKRADARYVSERNPHWIKAPCRQRDSFYVVGWAERQGRRFDGLLVHEYHSGSRKQGGQILRTQIPILEIEPKMTDVNDVCETSFLVRASMRVKDRRSDQLVMLLRGEVSAMKGLQSVNEGFKVAIIGNVSEREG
jgi:hypothetical protein